MNRVCYVIDFMTTKPLADLESVCLGGLGKVSDLSGVFKFVRNTP